MQQKLRFGIAFLCLIITTITAWYMLQLNAAETLWGYLPLLLFGSAWATILLGAGGYTTKLPENWKLVGLAVLSGILLSVGFPPLPFIFTMFIGFVPLLIAENIVYNTYKKPARWTIFKLAFIAFYTWNILTTYWVANTSFGSGVAANIANTLLMCIPFVLFHQTKHQFNGRWSYLPLLTYWVTFEYLHHHWDLQWSWLTLGNSMAQYPILAQWYEYVGHLGGSFWIVGLNILFYKSYQQYCSNKQFVLKEWSLGLVSLIVPCLFSIGLYFYNAPNANNPQIETVVVQPNYEPHYVKFRVGTRAAMNNFWTLAKTQLTDKTEYLIFPETSFNGVKWNTVQRNRTLKALQDSIKVYPNLKLLTGLGSYKEMQYKNESPYTQRHIRGRDTMYYESYNSALMIENGVDTIRPIYVKNKLVPGAEKMPLEFLVNLLGLEDIAGNMAVGNGAIPYIDKTNTLSIAPIICYESIFGEFVTGYVKRGADVFAIVTNDGWWANTAGHQQHLKFASLRAIETRRSIARSANTGISAFINTRGDILNPTKYDEATAIKGNLELNNRITFYVIWGDMIARLCGFLSLLLLAFGMSGRIK